ncbi:MAG: thiamine phosphate synthase [Myxococcota bacterium]
MKSFDPALYLVTDPRYPLDESELVALVRAGVSMVQLRDKAASTRALLERAKRWVDCLGPWGVPLIVNDRVDVAAAAGAAGVHLGQSDLPLENARAILGEDAIIGISLERLEAHEPDAGYVAVSPVHSTPTKTDTTAPMGIEGVRAVASRHTAPTVGIGGIGLREVGAVIRAGARGVAVVSAILAADDRVGAARRLRAEVDLALRFEPKT